MRFREVTDFEGISSIQCSLVNKVSNHGLSFQECESDVVVSHCLFAFTYETGAGGTLYLDKRTIGFSLLDSVLTNCIARVNAGGVYCWAKTQTISNSCFHQCTCMSAWGNAIRVFLASSSSTESREIVWSSFVSCPKTQNDGPSIMTYDGTEYLEDTNVSACKVVTKVYGAYIYKGFYSKRCTFSNDVGNIHFWLMPVTGTSYSFNECNLCNNHQDSSGTMISNGATTTCKGCVFIQNTFDSLSKTPNLLKTTSCKFYGNSFSRGSYATSLPLSHITDAICFYGVGSWKFSFGTSMSFSLWRVFKLSVMICVLWL